MTSKGIYIVSYKSRSMLYLDIRYIPQYPALSPSSLRLYISPQAYSDIVESIFEDMVQLLSFLFVLYILFIDAAQSLELYGEFIIIIVNSNLQQLPCRLVYIA